MSRTPEQVLAELTALLPPGWVWPRDDDALLGAILMAFARGIAELEKLAEAMMAETDPRSAILCLSDFERVLGPDKCLPGRASLPIADRQRLAHARWTARGGASIPYLLGIADKLGYEGTTIDEFRCFLFGHSRFGDPAWAFGPRQIRHYWRVGVPGARVTWFRFGRGVFGQDPHAAIARAEDLECRLRQLKHSQTELIFAYSGV